MSALVLEESGFRIEAPAPAFRLSELDAYRALSGRNLREMDLGWLWTRQGKQQLLLLEVKGREVWNTKPDDPTRPHEHLVRACVEKANDTLLMLAAVSVPTPWGQQLAAHLPAALGDCVRGSALKLVFLIDIPESNRELLGPVREKINSRLSGRISLFSLEHVSVIDFVSAQRMGLPVSRP